MEKLHTEHEPYSIDLLTYEIAESIVKNQPQINNRFTGKHVRGNSAKLAQLKRREKRLRRKNMTVLLFHS